jgi:hypothetical protein
MAEGGSGERENASFFYAAKVDSSLPRFETPAGIFLGHLKEDRGGFRISVLRFWHTFGFSVLRAQDLRKGKELF